MISGSPLDTALETNMRSNGVKNSVILGDKGIIYD